MDTAIVLFTRDLRLHDNPALHQARDRARQVVPLFVADPALDAAERSPNRARFLAESLADLRQALRERGADLVMREGDPAAEVIRLAAEVNAGAVYLAGDVSHYATARRRPARARMRPAPDRPRIHPRPDRGATWRPQAGRRRPLPRLHPVLAGLARDRLAPALPGAAAPRDAAGGRRSATCPRRGDGAFPGDLARAGSRRGEGGPPAVRQLAPAPAGRLRRRTTTTWPATRPPGSAPTCGSAASRRWRWRSARSTVPAGRSSAASSPGATSTTR